MTATLHDENLAPGQHPSAPSIAGHGAPSEPLPDDGDPAVRRRREAEALFARVGGDRHALEQLRAQYQRRLRAASDDVAATEALRVVELALTWVPPPPGPWDWQRPYERRSRRGRG